MAEVATLSDELDWRSTKIMAFDEEVARLRDALQRAYNHQRFLEGLCSAARSEITELQQKLARAIKDREVWRCIYELAKPGCTQPVQTTLATWMDQELRRILTLAHPDRWSQGQSASALAHEVAVAVNALRQNLEER